MRLSWRRLRSFSGGTKVMVAGMMRIREGQAVFVADSSVPLVAVSYDGEEAGLVGRILAAARSRNEFQNGFTFLSWAAGIAILGLVFVLSPGLVFLPSVLVLSTLVSLAPLLTFLPPGMLFVVVANGFWKRRLGILMRRDLASIPSSLRAAGENEGAGREGPMADTPRAGQPRANNGWNEARARADLSAGLAFLFLGLSVLVNGVLAFLVFRYIGGLGRQGGPRRISWKAFLPLPCRTGRLRTSRPRSPYPRPCSLRGDCSPSRSSSMEPKSSWSS